LWSWELSVSESHFKGWAKPGPVPLGTAARVEVPPGETLDAISGHFRIFQLRKGHRFSTDDVLTAWYGTSWAPSAGRVLDLGSGIGSVGMIAAWRLRGATFVTIEAQEDSVRLARKSAAYNGLLDRYEIRHGDLRNADALGTGDRFDLVLASPPYFPPGTGLEGDHPQKAACRFELRGDVCDYAKAAAASLAPGGFFACVYPEERHDALRAAAADARLAIVRSRPVVFREGEPPLVRLFGMMRAADLPGGEQWRPWVEPPLVIRASDGTVHPEYTAVKLAVGFPP
jgi:tRNA1(Val) A37 N6-methylase TrmN6